MSFLSRKAAEALEGIKDGLAAAAHGQTYGQYKRKQKEDEAAAAEAERWSKYSSSTTEDTGVNQTDYFEGCIGEKDGRRKVHVAIDENHNVLFVRDADGTVLFDHKVHKNPPEDLVF